MDCESGKIFRDKLTVEDSIVSRYEGIGHVIRRRPVDNIDSQSTN